MIRTGFEKGTRVRQTRAEAWGIGEILDDSDLRYVRVLFEDSTERTVQRQGIVGLTGEEAISPVLDRQLELRKLAAGSKRGGRTPQVRPARYTDAHLKEKFIARFPKGFQDPEYLTQERNEKVEAGRLLREMLTRDAMDSWILNEEFKAVAIAARKIISATRLISNAALIKLSNALKNKEKQKAFALGLQELLHGNESPESRFDSFVACLNQIGGCDWPIATYFLFLQDPAAQMFMKPAFTREVASSFSFPLNYHAKPNPVTYISLLEFARKLQEEFLSEMGPQDFIDVHSFISVSFSMAEGKYGKKKTARKKNDMEPATK